tara:strand:- start:411 stop:566 length:156 start_codon:yes stop_codon:yes gene_type:complete
MSLGGLLFVTIFHLPGNSLAGTFIQLGVKSNLGQVDFMEIGVGCLISKKQG